MYYDSLYYDLRDALTDAVVDAYNAGRGFWPSDRSARIQITSQSVISNRWPILPKLFRRITEYLQSHNSVVGFKNWLEQGNERVTVISRGQRTGFDNVIEQSGRVIQMTVEPEDLIFES